MCVSSTNQKYILILYYFIILTEKAAVETPNLKSSGKFPYKKMSSFANLFDLIKFDAKVAELLAVRSLWILINKLKLQKVLKTNLQLQFLSKSLHCCKLSVIN